MKLAGRLALITGGGRGIGRAIAFAFAREGANVAVAARTSDQVNSVANEIASECGVQTLAIECDVATSSCGEFDRNVSLHARGVARNVRTRLGPNH